MLSTSRWLLPACIPAGLFIALARSVARRPTQREPLGTMTLTFSLGVLAGLLASLAAAQALRITGLELGTGGAGTSGALFFVFLVVAPLYEAAKAAAAWPALLGKRKNEPYDGVVYAAASGLGFSTLRIAWDLAGHPWGSVWVARTLLALPAEVFFACLWGYALGRAKYGRRGPPLFPAAFLASVAVHGLYGYFVYVRGPGALLAATPLLAAMAVVTWLLSRDLLARTGVALARGPRSIRMRRLARPPSLAAVRAALRRGDEPVRLEWILFGSLVTFGAMIAGVASGVGLARALHQDLAAVDEHDLRSAWPALLLGGGLLASFPASGFLLAWATAAPTLLEPALATAMALGITVALLGVMAPSAVVFALAVSPIAWMLACVGAWAGRAR